MNERAIIDAQARERREYLDGLERRLRPVHYLRVTPKAVPWILCRARGGRLKATVIPERVTCEHCQEALR